MKIYYGIQPEADFFILDNCIYKMMRRLQFKTIKGNDRDYHAIEQAMNTFVKIHKDKEYIFWTMNPLLINFLTDEEAKQCVWVITNDGKEFNIKDDASMMEKLTVMGPGEVLADDSRIF